MYLLALSTLLLVSIYPLYMGAVMVIACIQNGGISAANYPSYVIPYTPICIALIFSATILPPVKKYCKKHSLAVLSAIGLFVFLSIETFFEKITIFYPDSSKTNIETWQLFSCISTPQVKTSVLKSLNIRYNPMFKLHFYAISILIIFVVIGVIHEIYNMVYSNNYNKKRVLIVQVIVITIFIGLCILACFTAFFRTGNILVSPLSAVLMALFFIVFGVTAGVYSGTWLYGKRKSLFVIVPTATAIISTTVMYIGEMVMMDGNLFRFGSGFLMNHLSIIPLAPIDLFIIILAGVATNLILFVFRKDFQINSQQ